MVENEPELAQQDEVKSFLLSYIQEIEEPLRKPGAALSDNERLTWFLEHVFVNGMLRLCCSQAEGGNIIGSIALEIAQARKGFVNRQSVDEMGFPIFLGDQEAAE